MSLAKPVTAEASIASVVNALIVLNSAAVLPVASADEITIVYALVPVSVCSESTVSVVAIEAVTVPSVKPSITFAWVTVSSSVIVRASLAKPVTPDELYRDVISAYVPVNDVISLASIVPVVFPSIAERSSAVAVASADEISIV